jgi:hypothetical protein
MDDHRITKEVMEMHVWQFDHIFKNCKERTMKNTNWTQAASGKATEEELRQFTNCVTKNIKAIAVYPTIID